MLNCGPAFGGQGQLTYYRHNALFTKHWFREALGRDVEADYLESMQEMDRPENLDALCEFGKAMAEQVKAEHLTTAFNQGVRLDPV